MSAKRRLSNISLLISRHTAIDCDCAKELEFIEPFLKVHCHIFPTESYMISDILHDVVLLNPFPGV